jgi:CRISPR-associated exonuclease Cas4
MSYIIAGLVLALFSLWLFLQARTPPGMRQLYNGPYARELNRQLVSWEYGVTGRPDFIVDHQGVPIPVLAKRGKAPTGNAHDAHVAQILIYCLLVHETTQSAPPYGIIRYSNRTFEVDYNAKTAEAVLDLIDEVRAQQQHVPLPRSHENERHCYACSHRKICDQRLV